MEGLVKHNGKYGNNYHIHQFSGYGNNLPVFTEDDNVIGSGKIKHKRILATCSICGEKVPIGMIQIIS